MKQFAEECLNLELKGIEAIKDILDENFFNICKVLANCKGKVIISGVGKSGHIGKKISSTMSSIGIASFFLHPTEASHGDLGMISANDVIVLISNSGETAEFSNLLEFIQKENITSIGITRAKNSTLSNGVRYKIIIPNAKEVVSYNAPTTSTTQTLVVGDILAICSSHLKKFTEYDYAKIHPGGKLGLSLNKIASIMNKNFAICDAGETIISVLPKMQSGIIVIAKNGILEGIFTDGDLRRAIIQYGDVASLEVSKFMTANPIHFNYNDPIIKAVEIFNEKPIGSIIVVDEKTAICGVVDRKDIEF
jgi:arabinose-5-phosphate isomerase